MVSSKILHSFVFSQGVTEKPRVEENNPPIVQSFQWGVDQ